MGTWTTADGSSQTTSKLSKHYQVINKVINVNALRGIEDDFFSVTLSLMKHPPSLFLLAQEDNPRVGISKTYL